MNLEILILSNLLRTEQFARKTIPYIKKEYFQDELQQLIFEEISEFFSKYNSPPTPDALIIEIDAKYPNMTPEHCDRIQQIIDSLDEVDPANDLEWLIDTTETWCQERAVYNAIYASVKIIDGEDKTRTKGELPQILSEALAVTFDPNIGHDFIDDAQERFDYYHLIEEKIPFDLEMFNKITKGGFSKKTLNIFMASTGVGKSLVMCHLAAGNLMDGKNVLYITLEMAEEKIAERIDANLLNIPIDEMETVPKKLYDQKMAHIAGKTNGKLVIKEYPTATAGTGHFRHLLNELKLKKSFTPDIIYIDYLNICKSSRHKPDNMYNYVKGIAEELRGLAIEFEVPIVSATQTNREGYDNSDFGLTNTSESIGVPATLDFMAAIISNEELEELGQYLIKQLKSRYTDPSKYKRFTIGVDKSKMRLFDVEDSAQAGILGGGTPVGGKKKKDVPAFDNSKFGERMNEDDNMKAMTKKAGRKDFSGMKF